MCSITLEGNFICLGSSFRFLILIERDIKNGISWGGWPSLG